MKDTETVLVLQGGGSLGAYECGVYKTLHQKAIDFDIISGTSVGALNALIIGGAKSDPSKELEKFWLELSDNMFSFMPDETRPYYSTYYTSIMGNDKMFRPKGNGLNLLYWAFTSPYLYSMNPLRKTLSKYVDFEKINNNSNLRLILTAVDIQQSRPVVFDSKKNEIDIDTAMATIGYPFYGIEWTKKDDRYLWDGSLMSNTPLREVINSSPKKDKEVYLISLFPRKHEHLPKNMFESWHRARDIMHTDKTQHNVDMSRVISKHLFLLKKMHSILEKANLEGNLKKDFDSLKNDYEKVAEKRGAIINKIIRIEREEETHFLLEDADFSVTTIKKLIKQGQKDGKNVLKNT